MCRICEVKNHTAYKDSVAIILLLKQKERKL